MTELRVSRQPSGEPEIFHSLQGEGITAGTPTVFLRLATCNLTCSWCDTKYTWDWKSFDYDREVGTYSLDDLESRILAYNCEHIVITGGEPLMQQRSLTPLAVALKQRGFYCEVETNGTFAPSDGMIDAISQWNVSPKLNNSGVAPEKREVAGALEAFSELDNAYFKFVVSEPGDVAEVTALVDRYGIPSGRVILMPEATRPDVLMERTRWLSDLCVKEGFRLSTRLHILLWGDERGK